MHTAARRATRRRAAFEGEGTFVTESTEQTTWAELATSDRPAAHYVSAPDGHGMPDVDPRYLSETLMLGNPGERR